MKSTMRIFTVVAVAACFAITTYLFLEHRSVVQAEVTEPPKAEGPAMPASSTMALIRGLYQEDFSDPTGHWKQHRGLWEINSGVLCQLSSDVTEGNAFRYLVTPRFADGIIEADVAVKPVLPQYATHTDADEELRQTVRYMAGAGILFRIDNEDNFYMFRLAGEEGAVLGRMVDGQWHDLRNPRFTAMKIGDRIRLGSDRTYRLKVECHANRIKCFVNDEVVCSISDGAFGLGQVGLVTFKTAAQFDNLLVHEIIG